MLEIVEREAIGASVYLPVHSMSKLARICEHGSLETGPWICRLTCWMGVYLPGGRVGMNSRVGSGGGCQGFSTDASHWMCFVWMWRCKSLQRRIEEKSESSPPCGEREGCERHRESSTRHRRDGEAIGALCKLPISGSRKMPTKWP